MSYEIAALSNLHLLPETKKKLNELAGKSLVFPNDESQPLIQKIIERTGKAKAVLVSPSTPIPKEYFQACPTVEYLGICGTAKENVDTRAAAKYHVTVTNVIDYGDEPTAEFIFMQLTSLSRGTGKYQWRENPVELMGKRLGIIGLGALGQAVAHLAFAYKMQVAYNSRVRKPLWEQKGAQYLEKNDLLNRSEIIVLTAPTNLQVLDKEDFTLIKPNTILLQASQGNCFDREGFIEWIAKDKNYAIFDYATGSENYQSYKEIDRVIFPQIIAGHTLETKQRLGDRVIANLKDYLANK